MNTWKIILATLVIFATGVVTGGLLVSYSDRAQQKHHRSGYREGAIRRAESVTNSSREAMLPPRLYGGIPQGLRLDFLQKLSQEVGLTTEQHQRIEKIIVEGQDRNRQLWHREMQQTRERIRAELKPEQVQRFEELMKQRRPAGQRKGDDLMPDRRSRRMLPGREGPEAVPAPVENR